MSAARARYKGGSNNAENPNKNICTLAVARAFGVSEEVRYLHTVTDVVRAVRKRYTVRSRLSKVAGKTIGGAREKLIKIAADTPRCRGFIIRVDGHVIVVDWNGKTAVDTDPRKRDRRKITHCYVVYAS